jgi:hypothetical protein
MPEGEVTGKRAVRRRRVFRNREEDHKVCRRMIALCSAIDWEWSAG